MKAIVFLPIFITLITVSTQMSDARTVTLYRTIHEIVDSHEAATEVVSGTQEVVEKQGKFYVVSGKFETFEGAMPEKGQNEEWNKRWKHVLPVDMTADEARQLNKEVQPLLAEKAIDRLGGVPEITDAHLAGENLNTVIQEVQSLEKQEDITTDELVNRLSENEALMLALAKNGSGESAEMAQLWLAKTYYLKGLAESKKRLPETSGMQNRIATPIEQEAYLSALEEYQTFLAKYPNSEHAEEVAYHIAATYYHLTYQGHHRYQVEKAKAAYQEFINQYPNSDRVPRAVMNLMGIGLELARMDEDEGQFQEVIDLGNDILNNFDGLNDYIKGRVSLMIAEAYMEGPKNYPAVIEYCDSLLVDFSTDENSSVIGSANRLKAYAHYFSGEYIEAIAAFSVVIDFYEDPKFHFGYQVDENLAAAYYWRGNAHKYLGATDLAIQDFETCAEQYPQLGFGEWAENEIDSLEMEE